jgi:hypothetical protein
MVAKGSRWPGAKNELGRTILSYAPINAGGKYIDVFAGRGALTFWAMELGFDFKEWIINDVNTVKFFEALRDVGDKVRMPPRRSREEFDRQALLAKQEDQNALLLEGWLCHNGATYDSGGFSSAGGRRSPESYKRNLRAGCLTLRKMKARISGDDWLTCIQRQKPGPNDLVIIDGPYMGCNVAPYKPDNILPIELIGELQSAPYPWVLCEYHQPMLVAAFGEPVFTKEVQLRATNFKQTGGQDRRVECVWTSDSYRAHLAKHGANRDMSRLAKPVPADRLDTYYADLPLEKLLAEIKDGMGVITGSRLQMNAEMRKRLLPALLVLRNRTYRKHPGFYERLRSIGLNGDTVRQWFYRSYTADEVIDLVEEKHPESKGGDRDQENDEESRGETETKETDDFTRRCLLQADKVVAALLRDKITLAKRLGREYAESRKLVKSEAQRELKKAA